MEGTDNPRTLEEVVGDNIRRLREARRWTAGELAEMLSKMLDKEYTRYSVADLEGRRPRDIRWRELAVLCALFDVPLWDLVLPPEGVLVDTTAAVGNRMGFELPDDPAEGGLIRYGYPSRDELAWRFFNIESDKLDHGGIQEIASQRARELRFEDAFALAKQLLPLLRRYALPNTEDSPEGRRNE